MRRPIPALLLLLLIQIVCVIAVYQQQLLPGPDEPQPSLTAFDPDLVDEIYITDDAGNETVLLRQGETWTLPELEELPVSRDRVSALLAAFSHGETGWPVADSVAARQRFQVAAYHFQRRLILIGGGELLGTVYLGTSPGFRQVHARNDAQDAIYSVALNTFDAPASGSEWLDGKLLQIRAPLAIVSDGYTLTRTGTSWQTSSGAVPDPREMNALLSALRSLNVRDLAEQDMQRELAESSPELVLQIKSLSGDSTLEFFELERHYYVYSSEYSLFFEIGAFDYTRLTGLDALLLAGLMDDIQ
jgi:hypothetical protein